MATIGFVTTQLPEVTTAGGIGFATKRLALLLAANNHEVHIFIARGEKGITQEIYQHYKDSKVILHEVLPVEEIVSPAWVSFQKSIDDVVSNYAFDLLICQEWQAPIVFTTTPGRKTPVITWLHGGTHYDIIGSQREIKSTAELMDIALETIQIEKSDLVVSPSKYLVDFYKQFQVQNENTNYISYPIPTFGNNSSDTDPNKIVLAFVSNLSVRKGFDEALDLCAKLNRLKIDYELRIYGKFMDIDPIKIKQFLQLHKIKHSFHQEMKPTEIWRELSGFNTTLLIPSRLDNIPGVLYEALGSSVRSIVSHTQGALELLDSFPEHILSWESQIEDIAEYISAKPILNLNVDSFNQDILLKWENLIKSIPRNKSNANELELRKKSISVVIITKDRAKFFEGALDSVLNQSYLPEEVIVVEDVSNGKTSVEDYCRSRVGSIKITYKSIAYSDLDSVKPKAHNHGQMRAARSRNIGAALAKNDILVFLDDDNLFLQNHLETLINMQIETGADAVTPYLAQILSNKPLTLKDQPSQIAIMLGDHLGSINLLQNVTMDSHILIKKVVFDELGGFPEDSFPEDWAFGLRLIGFNKRFHSTKQPTLLYRLNTDGIQAQITKKKRSPHNLDVESSAALVAGGNTWIVSHLARQSYTGRAFNSRQSNRFGIIKNGYVLFAIELIKKREYGLLWLGLGKFAKRLFLAK
jgi:glycosyltransferase involved in cell wall biosynthesis